MSKNRTKKSGARSQESESAQDDPLRGTGRTTALVLAVIADALADPGTPKRFVDHHRPMTAVRAKDCSLLIGCTVERLGLRYFRLSVSGNEVWVTSTVLEAKKQVQQEKGATS